MYFFFFERLSALFDNQAGSLAVPRLVTSFGRFAFGIYGIGGSLILICFLESDLYSGSTSSCFAEYPFWVIAMVANGMKIDFLLWKNELSVFGDL